MILRLALSIALLVTPAARAQYGDSSDRVQRMEVEMWRMQVEAEARRMEAARRADMKYRESEFRRKVEELRVALSVFEEAYLSQGGNIWPTKKADVVKKAICSLQRNDSRFGECR